MRSKPLKLDLANEMLLHFATRYHSLRCRIYALHFHGYHPLRKTVMANPGLTFAPGSIWLYLRTICKLCYSSHKFGVDEILRTDSVL